MTSFVISAPFSALAPQSGGQHARRRYPVGVHRIRLIGRKTRWAISGDLIQSHQLRIKMQHHRGFHHGGVLECVNLETLAETQRASMFTVMKSQ